MQFRRASARYGRTPEPETPYQKAAQVWDDRIGSARVQARNWRLIAFGNLILAGGGRAAFRASGGAALNPAGANSGPQSPSTDGGGTPAWAQQMRRRQAASQGVSHAAQALRAGDHGGGSASINLSEEK